MEQNPDAEWGSAQQTFEVYGDADQGIMLVVEKSQIVTCENANFYVYLPEDYGDLYIRVLSDRGEQWLLPVDYQENNGFAWINDFSS